MTAKKRGLRTAAQVVLSVAIGLIITVWRVDGVPTAVIDYLGEQAGLLLGTSGISGAIIGYLMNREK